MTVTRRMDTDEFKRLAMEEQGAVIRAWQLKPMAFNPPRPDDLDPEDPFEDEEYTVVLLNVLEPAFYKFPDTGSVVLVLPKTQTDDFDYIYMADVHPQETMAWGYRLAPKGWDAGNSQHDLDDANWYLKYDDTDLPDFDPERTETH